LFSPARTATADLSAFVITMNAPGGSGIFSALTDAPELLPEDDELTEEGVVVLVVPVDEDPPPPSDEPKQPEIKNNKQHIIIKVNISEYPMILFFIYNLF
jgi:hypothetical protein